MKKYKAVATYTIYCYAEVEAETEDDAWQIAAKMDGGQFLPMREYSDWRIDSIKEIKNDRKN